LRIVSYCPHWRSVFSFVFKEQSPCVTRANELLHHSVITLGCRICADSLLSNKPAHEAECKSSGGKWPASTSLQRKTLISFGFAETSGTPLGAPHSLLGFAGVFRPKPYGVWVLASKVEQMIGSFALAEQHPAPVEQRHLVQFGVFVQLFPVGTHASLLQ
jgi:hypothetical protein